MTPGWGRGGRLKGARRDLQATGAAPRRSRPRAQRTSIDRGESANLCARSANPVESLGHGPCATLRSPPTMLRMNVPHPSSSRAQPPVRIMLIDRLMAAGMSAEQAQLFEDMPSRLVTVEPRRPFREPGAARDEVMFVRSGILSKYKSDGVGPPPDRRAALSRRRHPAQRHRRRTSASRRSCAAKS